MNDNRPAAKPVAADACDCVKCGVICLPAAIVFCAAEFFVCATCAEGHLPITRRFLAESLIG